MRLVFIFAPAFIEWPKSIINELKKQIPELEIIAIASTRQVFNRLKEYQEKGMCDFLVLECLETRALEWLKNDFDNDRLRYFENYLGIKSVNDILIADRELAQGFVTGASPVESPLTLMVRDNDKKRAYITGLLDFYKSIFDNYNPDAVFLYAIADANRAALATIAQYEKASVLRLSHTRVDSRYMIDTNEKSFLNPVQKRLVKGEEPSAENITRAQKWLEQYRKNHNKQPGYMRYRQTDMIKKYSFVGIVKNLGHSLARLLLYRIVKGGRKSIYAETGLQRLKDAIIMPFKYYKYRYFTDFTPFEAIKNRSFIYFALHVEPESSTMYLTPDHTNQLYVIEALAKRKPLHMDIVVKEHPNMVGRRPAGFYKKIRNMPGVYLVDASVPSPEIIAASKLVATITGTVAWESILIGKPVVVVGDSPYLYMKGLRDGIIHERNFLDFGAAIEKAFTLPPVEDEKIIAYLAVLFEESFDLDMELLWFKNTAEDVAAHPDILDAMVRQIARNLKP